MIGPLPQLPFPSQPGPPGPPATDRRSPDLFEQLLADAEASLATGPALTDPSPGESPLDKREADPVAAVFDEFGFFGRAGLLGTQREPVVAAEPSGAPVPVDDIAQPPTATAGSAPAPSRPELTHPTSLPATLPFAEPARVRPRAASSLPGTVRGIAGIESAPRDVESDEARTVSRSPTSRPPTAHSPLQVALHELETGIRVAARVDSLDESERKRMREEIVRLLAEHGLTASDLRISGRPRGAAKETM